MNNHNPYVDNFLKIYSQSNISTGNTRGYDEETYIETRLDKNLIKKIFNPATKLVVLTGNAGDGKTAFIQKIENLAEIKRAKFENRTDNGCTFSLNGISFETLYDGSQDFAGKDNEMVLLEFFKLLEGDKDPKGAFTKIIAINEGKLRDFILNNKKYKWLGNKIFHYLKDEEYKLPESLVFINLNLRSVIDDNDNESIVDLLLNNFLDNRETPKGIWEHCRQENCIYSDRCYIKHNVDTLNDKVKGPKVRERLKKLLLAVHLKQAKHITMRDIRSVLSFVLFNKYGCDELHEELDTNPDIINRFYYNNIFNAEEKDRILNLLAKLDVAAVCNPKLDNFLYFTEPNSNEFNDLLNHSPESPRTDIEHLQKFYEGRPQGTQDIDTERKKNAGIYHDSIRRKLFFEGDEDKMQGKLMAGWRDLLPYSSKNFKLYETFLQTGDDNKNELRNAITLAISKSERIYSDVVGSENLCIRSSNSSKSNTKAFYGFSAADFKVQLHQIGQQENYIEYKPSSVVFKHIDGFAQLEISLDLFEILMRIKEGYVPTSSEIKTFFLNLEMFKRRVVTKQSERVFLTEDDTNLFKIERNAGNKLVMTKA
jgi:hypothetical protein